jgi:hypothetical protein
MYYKAMTTLILTTTGQTALHGMFLDEQFRMHTPILTNSINYTFYHSQMVDAVKFAAPSPNVKLFKDLFNKKLGIAPNFVVVIVKESKSFIESGGNSMYNPGTQHFAIELMQEAVHMLQSDGCTADRNMSLASIGPYPQQSSHIEEFKLTLISGLEGGSPPSNFLSHPILVALSHHPPIHLNDLRRGLGRGTTRLHHHHRDNQRHSSDDNRPPFLSGRGCGRGGTGRGGRRGRWEEERKRWAVGETKHSN